jgi:hypothetical protein
MADHDLRHRTVARVKHQRVRTAQRGAQSFRVGVAGGTRADARRPSPGRRHAQGQRDDLMGLLTGQERITWLPIWPLAPVTAIRITPSQRASGSSNGTGT